MDCSSGDNPTKQYRTNYHQNSFVLRHFFVTYPKILIDHD